MLENVKKIFDKDRDETLVDFDREVLKRKLMAPVKWTGQKIKEGWEWSKEHPAEALAIGTTVVTGGYNLVKMGTKRRQIRHEEYIADCRFYDPRYGEYVFSKRKLTTGERNRLKDIYNSDRKMSYSQALTKMGLNKD